MTDLLDRLKSAVADRYSIQQELGRGGAWIETGGSWATLPGIGVCRSGLGVLAQHMLRAPTHRTTHQH